MKKLLFIISFVAFMATNAMAGPYDFVASVYRATTTTTGDVVLTEAITGITYQVLTAGGDSVATITAFGDDAATAKTNPVTTTVFAADDRIEFRSSGSATTVDIVVTDTVGGFSTIVNGFSVNDHKIVIDETAGVKHHGLVPFTCAAAETDTGIDFNYDSRIENVTVEVITAGTTAGNNMQVGLLSSETSGDANGFVVDWDVERTGYFVMTLASNGALLDDGTNFYPGGHYVESANAQSLTFTCDRAEGVGYIHYDVTEVR